MEGLPQDIIGCIFQLLSPQDFYSLLLVSKSWNHFVVSSLSNFMKKQESNSDLCSVYRMWKLSRSHSPTVLLDRVCRVGKDRCDDSSYSRFYASSYYFESKPTIIIRVSQPTFGRQVIVHWTADHWKTVNIKSAKYCITSNFGNGKQYEMWGCSVLPYEDSTLGALCQREDIEFAICLKQDNWETWDNNEGQNYKCERINRTYVVWFGNSEIPPWMSEDNH